MNLLKRLLMSALPFLATSCKQAADQTGDVRIVSPKDILFSVPTLCDPAPAVEESSAIAGARSLHEDEWRQIEFVPVADESYMRKELAALATFKTQHQRASGWTSVYLRKEHPHPIQELDLQYSSLPAFGTSPLTLSGRPVRGGFALADGGYWFIYGQRSPEGKIIQLAVSPGRSACSERFAEGLVQITRSAGLLLVDWYAGGIVDVTSSKSVSEWTRRYGAH